MEMDRLSALPDSLLLLILHRLGMKEAAKTAVLSKQWRFLWTNLPFRFWEKSEETEKIRRFVARVDAVLALRRGPSLNFLHVSFHYDKRFASDVDSWVYFAAKNNVKELSLILERDYRVSYPHMYALPQIIYSVSSLTWLDLENCIIKLPETAVEWRCLTTLKLRNVELPQQAIGEIVSHCPMLENLDLRYCKGFDSLEIGGRSFRSLRVCYYSDEHLLEISAPYMLDLNIVVMYCRYGRVVRLKNVPSLKSARIECFERDWDSISMEEVMHNAVELFQALRHVEKLDLLGRCSEVLSIMGTKGWILPQFRLKYLVMEAASNVCSITGVIAMLESTRYVETLSISGDEREEEESINWGPITRDDLNCDLLHLKFVRFKEFVDLYHSWKPTLTLAQILLKRAPVLEKMVIHVIDYYSIEEIDLVRRTLLSYPKSSQKISFEIRQPYCRNQC